MEFSCSFFFFFFFKGPLWVTQWQTPTPRQQQSSQLVTNEYKVMARELESRGYSIDSHSQTGFFYCGRTRRDVTNTLWNVRKVDKDFDLIFRGLNGVYLEYEII